MPFTLIQISDCHLAADPATDYRGINADATLQSLLPAVRALAPDAVVLSGDVSEDASAESYARAVNYFEGLAPRVAWLPGNHDRRETMAQAFEPAGFRAGPVEHWGGWQIVLLDSSVPDRPEGTLDPQRLAPLDDLDSERPALVFIHHQPVPVGAPWIDKYALREPERLWEKLDARVVRAVAFGHVHQVRSGEKNAIAWLSAPATSANSQLETERFTLDPTGPKARWFRLEPDGGWTTGILGAG